MKITQKLGLFLLLFSVSTFSWAANVSPPLKTPEACPDTVVLMYTYSPNPNFTAVNFGASSDGQKQFATYNPNKVPGGVFYSGCYTNYFFSVVIKNKIPQNTLVCITSVTYSSQTATNVIQINYPRDFNCFTPQSYKDIRR
jgi:hypothetical protein